MKIVGHLRLFNKQRNVIGFYIKPIEDFNEVTHHLVETIFGHLALTKGIPLVSETAMNITVSICIAFIVHVLTQVCLQCLYCKLQLNCLLSSPKNLQNFNKWIPVVMEEEHGIPWQPVHKWVEHHMEVEQGLIVA